ncbi:hypothetical protein BO82DRAFT_413583 [Aspergillus uvarum CBS 121591]|uniref:Uncharacterized protein n=1 Tax=Aspergillus uvarum CBS 121591 TaxID=1448315 RepID=A0A319DTA7_9EURO|nr:hypothetical protein BO82DRAFT_413583 [Aspergillus uvarum CBS 121591]PYH82412.1 hypothetical protein BO82DRAFT_413583 [Aspergillus uvarum CBS 121591]
MVFPYEKLPAITQIEKIAQIFDEAGVKHIVWTGSILRLYGVEDTQLSVPHYIEFVVENASMVRAVQLLYEESFSRGLDQMCGRSGGLHDVGTEIVQLSTGEEPHLDLYLHTCSKVFGSRVIPDDDDPDAPSAMGAVLVFGAGRKLSLVYGHARPGPSDFKEAQTGGHRL